MIGAVTILEVATFMFSSHDFSSRYFRASGQLLHPLYLARQWKCVRPDRAPLWYVDSNKVGLQKPVDVDTLGLLQTDLERWIDDEM